MKKLIIMGLLISTFFSGIAYAASLTWYCRNCGQTFYFDPRDTSYMNSWIANHQAVCGRGGDSTETRQIDWSRVSLPGYLFLGGLVGGTLGGLYGLAYAQPEMWAYAGLGAFLGGIFMGLIWVVNAT